MKKIRSLWGRVCASALGLTRLLARPACIRAVAGMCAAAIWAAPLAASGASGVAGKHWAAALEPIQMAPSTGAKEPSAQRPATTWQVALEGPWLAGFSDLVVGQRASWGYALGLGLSTALGSAVEVSLRGTRQQTTDGMVNMTYASGRGRAMDPQVAGWRAWLATLGVSYRWGRERLWSPYAGLDVVGGYGGYALTYMGDLAKSLQVPQTWPRPKMRMEHLGQGWLWGGGAHAGLRLQLADWLATHTELGVALIPVGSLAVSNNRAVVDARIAPHVAFLVHGAFSLQIGL